MHQVFPVPFDRLPAFAMAMGRFHPRFFNKVSRGYHRSCRGKVEPRSKCHYALVAFDLMDHHHDDFTFKLQKLSAWPLRGYSFSAYGQAHSYWL